MRPVRQTKLVQLAAARERLVLFFESRDQNFRTESFDNDPVVLHFSVRPKHRKLLPRRERIYRWVQTLQVLNAQTLSNQSDTGLIHR